MSSSARVVSNRLAAAGSTGNNTHASQPAPGAPDRTAIVFTVEAVGATPTVTWKVQGSMDDTSVADGSSAWFDLAYVTDASDTTATAALTATAVGAQLIYRANGASRFFKKFRVVTTSNTNVTYHADIYWEV